MCLTFYNHTHLGYPSVCYWALEQNLSLISHAEEAQLKKLETKKRTHLDCLQSLVIDFRAKGKETKWFWRKEQIHVSVNQYVLTCHTQCITIKCVEHIYNQSIKKLVHITSFRSLNNKHVWLATQNTLPYNSLIHNMFTMCSFIHVLIRYQQQPDFSLGFLMSLCRLPSVILSWSSSSRLILLSFSNIWNTSMYIQNKFHKALFLL